MRLSYLPSEFQKALPILEKIKAAGFEAYFVGGSVRDALLNRPIHDVDIASSSYPEETKQIFERTVDIGIEHGTVLVLSLYTSDRLNAQSGTSRRYRRFQPHRGLYRAGIRFPADQPLYGLHAGLRCRK